MSLETVFLLLLHTVMNFKPFRRSLEIRNVEKLIDKGTSSTLNCAGTTSNKPTAKILTRAKANLSPMCSNLPSKGDPLPRSQMGTHSLVK